QRAEFPAAFQLVAAMNPCPCGRHGLVKPACKCNPARIAGYRARISGPLLDRIDLQLRLAPVKGQALVEQPKPGTDPVQDDIPGPRDTAQARALVERARARQLARQ